MDSFAPFLRFEVRVLLSTQSPMNQSKELELPQSELTRELRDYFPQLSSEDITRFEAHLHERNIADERNGYRLNFVGREYARLQTGLVSDMLISPDTEHNAQPENAQSGNIFITGDNLEALRHLQNAYAGKVKMIYIDPPYNTGKEFVYNDIFELSDEKLKIALGYSAEEIARLKSIQGKSSHSAWLTFMYPRLALAKKLLTDDGVIFVSIDDNEQANLKLLMDDVFGEGNFISNSVIITNRGGRDYGGIAQTHDYLIIYSKMWNTELKMIEDENKHYDFHDELGGFNLMELRNRNVLFNDKNRPNLCYPFYVNPNSVDNNGLLEISLTPQEGFNEVMPLKSQGIQTVWRWGKEKALNNLNKEIKGKRKQDGGYMIVQKSRISAKRQRSLWDEKEFVNERGSESVKELFGENYFSYPKSPYLIKRAIQLATDFDSSDLILDFFAGSGTTAHAVMQLNAEDGGNRRWMMVQWDEPTNPDSEARKTGGYETIDQISRKRIRLAGEKIKAQQLPNLFDGDNAATIDTGFKHYCLVAPQIQTLDIIETFDPNLGGFEDMITPMGGTETILATWLIDDGYPFDTKVEEIVFEGYTAHYVGGDSQTLYLIDRGLTTSALKAMLNQIGQGKLIVSTIVVYPYSVEFEMMRELEIGVKMVDGLKLKKRY